MAQYLLNLLPELHYPESIPVCIPGHFLSAHLEPHLPTPKLDQDLFEWHGYFEGCCLELKGENRTQSLVQENKALSTLKMAASPFFLRSSRKESVWGERTTSACQQHSVVSSGEDRPAPLISLKIPRILRFKANGSSMRKPCGWGSSCITHRWR